MDAPAKVAEHRIAMEQWEVLINDHHPAYITWERYLENLKTLAANRAKSHAVGSGAPREGNALLAGMLRVEHDGGTLDVRPGQAVIAEPGEWVRYSTPEGAEYIAVCLPAFSPDTVHRED
jgi:hypothetical protein